MKAARCSLLSSVRRTDMPKVKMDFLHPQNACGQSLIRIATRGSSIIAELLRLSANIPEAFLNIEQIKDPEQRKYVHILFDFQYLRDQDEFEKKINDNQDLLDLDQEFHENFEEILGRFFLLFHSIWKFQADFGKFIEDVVNGYYIQHSLDSILAETEGRQLLCEVLYLYGIMLLFMEDKIPGYIREKLMIAFYRVNNGIGIENMEEVFKLARNTGYIPISAAHPEGKRPKQHPELLFARFPIQRDLVRLVIGRLQTDDIYLMNNAFPDPDHRSTRLAGQAAMLYVILYFSPEILMKQKTSMREIVDKYFHDNWVIALYMGNVVDLSQEWAPYPSAKSALENVLNPTTIKIMQENNLKLIQSCNSSLAIYLREGILVQDYLLDHINQLLNCVRQCNIALRWRLLHRRCKDVNYRKVIDSHPNMQAPQVVALLLQASQLEYILKDLFQQLLDEKDTAWSDGRIAAAERMQELSEYFTGEKALAKNVKRDENLMKWFANLAAQVNGLNLDEGHATATGRTIKNMTTALEDVEQFEAVDTNVQIKSYLAEVRDIFRTMIRTVNIKAEVLSMIESISDLSYAWQILTDYIPVFHERISRDPGSVVLLRATFLKAASMLDVPLVRITAIDSADAVSVAAYYSTELVDFVRIVLEVIPVSVFRILGQIVHIQTTQMITIPMRLEAKDLKEYAQLDRRHELAKLTHQISIFTEGILVMEKTLLGVIQVEPRQILEEGLRRELVRLISFALNKYLTFQDLSRVEINENMSKMALTLNGLKRSIEYLQDYISIAGLKIYQQEFSRIINYNTEQESNRYLKKKTFDTASRYQSKAIPIPRMIMTQGAVYEGEEFGSLTFMGRVMSSLLYLTDPTRTVYAPECAAWFEHPRSDQYKTIDKAPPTIESCGIRFFALLEKSIDAIGLRGIDRLLAFRTVHALNSFVKFYTSQVHPFRSMLDQIRSALFPEYKIPPNANKLYANALKKVEHLFLPILKVVRRIGQGQLLRRQIANLLQFSCQLEAHMFYQALDTFNRALINDIRTHQVNPDHPHPEEGSPMLYEVSNLVEACGLDDPLQKVYITSQPLEGLPVLMFLFILAYLPKLEYDVNFGTLIRRKSKYPLDGLPMIVGLACLLKQFHPSYARKVFSYIGQFIRSNLSEAFREAEKQVEEMPREVLCALVFLDQLCEYSSLPRTIIHEFVPAYIFDALIINNKMEVQKETKTGILGVGKRFSLGG